MEAENRHDFDAVIATFDHPRYELVGVVMYQLDPFWIHNLWAKVKALTYQAMEA